jgi:predicted amidophosphoribosyltransferase
VSPSLSDEDALRLLDRPTHRCPACEREVALNYCARCDLYYSAGHATSCRLYDEHPHLQAWERGL